MTERCTLCGRPLTAPVYSDSGAAYGSTCAERVGLVRAPTPRDATRTPLRVPRGGEDERQLGLAFAEACATFAADYQAALDAQRDVWGWMTDSAASACGNSNAPAGGIAEASCPQP